MSKHFHLISIFLLLTCLSFAQDIPVVSVVKEAAAKQTVDLSGLRVSGQQGKVFLDTLKRNLELSGYFKVAPRGSVKVSGSLLANGVDGANVACTVEGSSRRFRFSRSDKADSVARHLVDAMVEQLHNKRGIASTKLAMVLYRSPNNADLYTCYTDGYGLKQITRMGKAAVGPRWSPDASTLYFTSYKRDFPAAYCVASDGSDLRQLMRFNSLNTGANLSPNGTQIALVISYNGNPELCTLDPNKASIRRLTNTKFAAEASPSWSPDGKQIVYVSDPTKSPHLYIVDVATRKSRRLTYRGSESVNPCWGSNGLICFATRRGSGYQIATIDPKIGESSVKIIGAGESPSWAADGRHIVCSRQEGRSSSIWLLDTEGDPAVRISRYQGKWICPAAATR